MFSSLKEEKCLLLKRFSPYYNFLDSDKTGNMQQNDV